MAQVTDAQFDETLQQVLAEGLRDVGLEVTVRVEPIPETRLHRVFVITSQRDRLKPSEWQNVLWRIIHHRLGEDAEFRISMILTLTPEDWETYQQEDDD